MTPVVDVHRLVWSVAGRAILSDVSFAVAKGECVAVMGRNGAGKSTLLDLLAGLKSPAAGTIELGGHDARQLPARERARLVAHLPQQVRADVPFRAHELVLMGRYPHTDRWFESDTDRSCVEDAMRRAGCWELRDRMVATLSGGERQRVLLAACLAQTAAILLLDEPSTHLDIDQQLHCFSLLRDESRRGVTCISVMHDLNLALAFATRLIVIANGRVALDAPVEEVAASREWLGLFSDRLTLARNADGRPWVSYS